MSDFLGTRSDVLKALLAEMRRLAASKVASLRVLYRQIAAPMPPLDEGLFYARRLAVYLSNNDNIEIGFFVKADLLTLAEKEDA